MSIGTNILNNVVKGSTELIQGVCKIAHHWLNTASATALSPQGMRSIINPIISGTMVNPTILDASTENFIEDEVVIDANGRLWLSKEAYYKSGGFPDGLPNDNFIEINMKLFNSEIKKRGGYFSYNAYRGTNIDDDFFELIGGDKNLYEVTIKEDGIYFIIGSGYMYGDAGVYARLMVVIDGITVAQNRAYNATPDSLVSHWNGFISAGTVVKFTTKPGTNVGSEYDYSILKLR